jgi:hypothetical protein
MWGFVGKARTKETIRKTRHRWEDDIKMDLREIWWGGMDWIDLADSINCWEILELLNN